MNTATQNRCHTFGTCCMDSTCSRRFECAMETKAVPPGDEAQDQPVYTPEACESFTLRALAGLALIALVSLLLGLHLLWTHDTSLRPVMRETWEVLVKLYWTAMPLIG